METSPLVVRHAKLEDGPAIERLWHDLLTEASETDGRYRPADDALERWRADFPEWLQDTTHLILVAYRGSVAAGFISARLWGPAPIFEPVAEMFIEFLFVARPLRRQGVATALFTEALGWGARLGATRVRLERLARDDGARAFWEKCGADPFGVEMTVNIPEPLKSPIRRRIGFRGNSP